MRCKDASTNTFSHMLNELSMLMAYEVARHADGDIEVETPLKPRPQGSSTARSWYLCPILRAGNAPQQSVQWSVADPVC
jgi:uracil phosphoribosyltransferase